MSSTVTGQPHRPWVSLQPMDRWGVECGFGLPATRSVFRTVWQWGLPHRLSSWRGKLKDGCAAHSHQVHVTGQQLRSITHGVCLQALLSPVWGKVRCPRCLCVTCLGGVRPCACGTVQAATYISQPCCVTSLQPCSPLYSPSSPLFTALCITHQLCAQYDSDSLASRPTAAGGSCWCGALDTEASGAQPPDDMQVPPLVHMCAMLGAHAFVL
jgi:hypothetical protein